MRWKLTVTICFIVQAVASQSQAVNVNARNPKVSTGEIAIAGSQLTILASGSVTIFEPGGNYFGPDGETSNICLSNCYLNGAPKVALIGEIDGIKFFVGSSYDEIALASGTLYLRVNDDYYPDNNGSFFTTSIIVGSAGGTGGSGGTGGTGGTGGSGGTGGGCGGAIGCWRFEEGAADGQATGAGSVLDSSGSGFHGTPTSPGPIYRSNVKFSPLPVLGFLNNLSLDFNGVDDEVSIGIVPALQFGTSQDFSLVAWIKHDSTSIQNGSPILSNRHDSDTLYLGYSMAVDTTVFGGTAMCEISVAGGGGPEDRQRMYGTTDLMDAEWHHVACTVDRDGLYKVYVDGALENSVTTLSGNIDSPNPLQIGAHGAGNPAFNHFQGLIDEVTIHDRVLSDQEILLLSGGKVTPSLAPFGIAMLCTLLGLAGLRRLRE